MVNISMVSTLVLSCSLADISMLMHNIWFLHLKGLFIRKQNKRLMGGRLYAGRKLNKIWNKVLFQQFDAEMKALITMMQVDR